MRCGDWIVIRYSVARVTQTRGLDSLHLSEEVERPAQFSVSYLPWQPFLHYATRIQGIPFWTGGDAPEIARK